MISDALAYAEKGWPIFPARTDKTPYTKHGVNDATTNLKQIKEWWERWPQANIALDVGGMGMMVLDLDPGHSMEELEKNVGHIPETRLRATTPRGGKHLFFRIYREEIVAPSSSKLASNVDVRSNHSYVLLPPSKTKDGIYQWQNEGKPAYRSDAMLHACNTGREKHKDHDTWLIEPDLPENVAAAIKWLREDAKIAIDGQGGDNMAYATATHMKSFGISQELAFDLIWEHWNPRCSPPWSADNVEHLQRKVENGYAYNTSPPGNITPGYHTAHTASLFKPVVRDLDSGHEINAGRFRFVDEEGMSSIRPPEWLIGDLITAGSYAMLFGAPGTFKTFIALDMALTIASGGLDSSELCWPEVPAIGPVLFAAGEGRSDIAKRVSAWHKKHNLGEETGNFILGDPVPLVAENHTPFLEGAKLASPGEGYKLVILDTVGRSMAGMNENAQQDASAFTNLVEHIQYELGAAVLALHHTGLNEKHRSRGSSVFGADTDTIIRLDRETKAKVVSLTMTKQKDAPEWEKKKYVRLDTIIVSMDPLIDSLVAVKPSENECPKGDKFHPTADENVAQLEAVGDAVLRWLESDKLRKWSTSKLADAIATDEHIDIGSSQLKQRHLILLREDNSKAVSRFYNAETAKWGYSD